MCDPQHEHPTEPEPSPDDDPLKRWKARPIKRSSVNPKASEIKGLFENSDKKRKEMEFIEETIR